MNTTYKVKLSSGFIGTVSDDTLDGQHPSAFIGEELNVKGYDENGELVEECGILVEVLN